MDEFFEETIAIELKKEVPGCIKVNFLPAVKRCLKDPPYLRSAGKNLKQYFTRKFFLFFCLLHQISGEVPGARC